MLPIIIGLWIAAGVQRALGAYMGYGRNLFVRRVQLEAERRLLAQAARVDLGHFDNSDWHDRLARARRDVSWRPGDLTWSVLEPGNIVSIVLMAALLASLHYLLVVLALTAAVLSLALERRITARMCSVLLSGNAGGAGTRLSRRPPGAATQHKGNPGVHVLADYLLGRHTQNCRRICTGNGRRCTARRPGSRCSPASSPEQRWPSPMCSLRCAGWPARSVRAVSSS